MSSNNDYPYNPNYRPQLNGPDFSRPSTGIGFRSARDKAKDEYGYTGPYQSQGQVQYGFQPPSQSQSQPYWSTPTTTTAGSDPNSTSTPGLSNTPIPAPMRLQRTSTAESLLLSNKSDSGGFNAPYQFFNPNRISGASGTTHISGVGDGQSGQGTSAQTEGSEQMETSQQLRERIEKETARTFGRRNHTW